MTFDRQQFGTLLTRYKYWICIFVLTYVALVPLARAATCVEIDYNEGWNIYNAETVVHHGLLYAARYGWTTVNYPFLSFYLLAQLHGLTHEYLFTGRVASLLALVTCCLLVASISNALGASSTASAISGFFCFGLFCSTSNFYVAMDDPQLLAHVFYLAGLRIYLYHRNNPLFLTLVSACFVFAACIKHNPVDAPLGVLIDLFLLSPLLAIWFCTVTAMLITIAVIANIDFGGPYFIAQLLSSRPYSLLLAAENSRDMLGPLLLPLSVALYVAWKLRKGNESRVIVICFVSSLLLGIYFSGGIGISVNAFFSSLFYLSLLLAFLWETNVHFPLPYQGTTYRAYVLPSLFLWLLIPTALAGNLDIHAAYLDNKAMRQNFEEGVTMLKRTPGPALCESLLQCSIANKPFLYDPFNVKRLEDDGKLDNAIMLRKLASHYFTSIQLDSDARDPSEMSRFTPATLHAIVENYTPVIKEENLVIYVPK